MLRSLAKTASLALRSSSTQGCSSLRNGAAGQIRGMAGRKMNTRLQGGVHHPGNSFCLTL